MSNNILKLSEFTNTPGSRFKRDHSEPGHSGEEFRDLKLIPALKDAIKKDIVLYVNLDDVAGYPASFIDEAFGKLANFFTFENLKAHMYVSCSDDPSVVIEVWDDIKDYVISRNVM